MKYIYQVSTCDEWKTYASMRTVLCTSSVRKLKKEINKLLAENECFCKDIEYLDKAFNCPTAYMVKESLNHILDYLCIEIWED